MNIWRVVLVMRSPDSGWEVVNTQQARVEGNTWDDSLESYPLIVLDTFMTQIHAGFFAGSCQCKDRAYSYFAQKME